MAFPPIRLRAALTLGGLSVRELINRTWVKINEHEIMTRAAGVSFYAMLAFGAQPISALVLFLTARLLPDLTGRKSGIGNLTTEGLRTTLQSFLPAEGYRVFEDQISRLQSQSRPPMGLLLVSTAITIWLASSLFVAIIDAMNRIYGVVETRSFLKIRLLAIVMTCLEALILAASLLAIVLWPWITQQLGLSQPLAFLATTVQWTVVTFMVLVSFALSFYVGPDADQKWEWITPGSFAGTVVFLLSCVGFRIYVQNYTDYDRTYGSLGGVMVLMFWLWISSLVMLTAAQVNKIIEEASPLGRKFGQKIDASELPDLEKLVPEPVQTPVP